MFSRRKFLQHFSPGLVILSGYSKAAFARRRTPVLESGRSKVVVARDAFVHDDFRELIDLRVQSLLDRAIFSYTGQIRSEEGWRLILGDAQRIGIKVNGSSGRYLATHPILVYAIVQRLLRAGIRPENVLIWDDKVADLKACGFKIATDPGGIRCFGSDMAGYEETPESWGSVRVRLSKILTSECDLVIGVPVLKDDKTAGVNFAMKNMYGVIDQPQELDAAECCTAIADLNCIPTIRKKMRFTIGDAFSGIYDGGPAVHIDRLWYPNALIVGTDRVAVDQIAWRMIDNRRAQAGLKSLAASGRAPAYIAIGADSAHALGTDDVGKIDLSEV